MTADVIALASAAAAILSAVWAAATWMQAKRTNEIHVLAQLQVDYAHPEMFIALVLLANAKRVLNSSFVETWVQLRREELRLSGTQELTAYGTKVRNAADVHRRRVSHFFQRMSMLYISGAVLPDQLFAQWSPHTFEILPEIIIPLENAIAKDLSRPELPPDHPLWRLYNGAKAWHERNLDRKKLLEAMDPLS